MVARFALFRIYSYFGSIDEICRNESLLEFGLDAAQTFLSPHAVAEIAGTQTEIRLRVGEVDGNVGEGTLKLFLHLLSVLQGLVTNLHKDVDSIAAE